MVQNWKKGVFFPNLRSVVTLRPPRYAPMPAHTAFYWNQIISDTFHPQGIYLPFLSLEKVCRKTCMKIHWWSKSLGTLKDWVLSSNIYLYFAWKNCSQGLQGEESRIYIVVSWIFLVIIGLRWMYFFKRVAESSCWRRMRGPHVSTKNARLWLHTGLTVTELCLRPLYKFFAFSRNVLIMCCAKHFFMQSTLGIYAKISSAWQWTTLQIWSRIKRCFLTDFMHRLRGPIMIEIISCMIDVNTRCLAHVIISAIERCMSDICKTMENIRLFLNATQCSEKRTDIYAKGWKGSLMCSLICHALIVRPGGVKRFQC